MRAQLDKERRNCVNKEKVGTQDQVIKVQILSPQKARVDHKHVIIKGDRPYAQSIRAVGINIERNPLHTIVLKPRLSIQCGILEQAEDISSW